MHADRWSATTWIAALLIDVALCIYLAAAVCSHAPQPPPDPPHDELVLPGETMCGAPYRQRMWATSDSLEVALEATVDEAAKSSDYKRRVIEDRVDELRLRFHRVRRANELCRELEQAELNDGLICRTEGRCN